MQIPEKGILLVVSGPSGVGKGTVMREYMRLDRNACYSISATTRQPRPGERDGKEYYFLSKEEFLRRREDGDFLEWAEVFGNFYGTLRSEVHRLLTQGRNVILEIDVQGAMQIKDAYPSGLFVFIMPPSLKELRRRITSRGTETPEVLALRLSCAEEEMSCAHKYDYTIVNERIGETARRLQAIVNDYKKSRDSAKENELA